MRHTLYWTGDQSYKTYMVLKVSIVGTDNKNTEYILTIPAFPCPQLLRKKLVEVTIYLGNEH